MKKTILAIALALPVLATTTLAHAEYIMSIGMETPQGGSLPQGSISFSNAAVVTEPTIPVLPDLYGKVDPTCEPFTDGSRYTTDLSNRETLWGAGYSFNNYTDGSGRSYIPCKLKPSEDPKVIGRFMWILPTSEAHCGDVNDRYTNACEVAVQLFSFGYFKTKMADGSYSFETKQINIKGLLNALRQLKYSFADVDRVVFDGFSCTNVGPYISYHRHSREPTTTTEAGCDTSLTYDQLIERAGKEFMIVVYKK